jgi:uncharacterized integral membrane protein
MEIVDSAVGFDVGNGSSLFAWHSEARRFPLALAFLLTLLGGTMISSSST